MRWKGRRGSDNIEDRRGIPAGGLAIGGGGIGIVIMIVYVLLGGNPQDLSHGHEAANTPKGPFVESETDAERREFVSVVLADTEEVWRKELPKQTGRAYADPTLVLFTDSVDSACGFASAAVGPFYCGEDRKVYIDLGFYDLLTTKFQASGDFAQAYVIAHEVGHHIQNLLGTLDQVHAAKQRLSEGEYNQLSVRLELQADYFAGAWAHHAQRMAGFDEEDIREGLTAANAIGDDTLQKQSQGYVVPDSFTHGTGTQRVEWFLKGWRSGLIKDGDTFKARKL